MKRYRKVPTVAEPVETLIALRYPNGRIHETAVDRQITLGDQFEMYGRTWTAMRTKARRQRNNEPRTLCVPAGSVHKVGTPSAFAFSGAWAGQELPSGIKTKPPQGGFSYFERMK